MLALAWWNRTPDSSHQSRRQTGVIQHGHTVQTMLPIYAAWIEGAEDEDVETIKRAMHGYEAKPASN